MRTIRLDIDFEMTRKQADAVNLRRVDWLIKLYMDHKRMPERKINLNFFFFVKSAYEKELDLPNQITPHEAKEICGSLECLAGETVVQFGETNLRLSTNRSDILHKVTKKGRKYRTRFLHEADRLLGTDLHDQTKTWYGTENTTVSSSLSLFDSNHSDLTDRAEILLRLRDLRRRVLIGRKLPKVKPIRVGR